ncbi:MAG: biosynthetic-type acetolactate synthase large subunit [Clostridia bacterium]|nr:biosynthetic-type acetolactate synthase large subunit [Clostridia bacterium]
MIMNGAQIAIETLIEQGVTDVFGYPGGQVLNIYDALYCASDRLRHILTAHEQGAAHAADGYARVTGKVGVVIATSGPGATNLVTGIATAMLDSVPMVAITGNVPTYLIGRDGFQEVDITGVTMPITKHNYFVTKVEDLAETIRDAFRIAKSGRPGPVLIDIPKDVQEAECEYTYAAPYDPIRFAQASEALISEAADMINSAVRPYIYIGGGAAREGLSREIIALADKIDGYIGSSLMGLSLIPNSHVRFLGMQGMHGRYASSRGAKEADVIIAIGVRFSDRAIGDVKQYSKNAKIIQLDGDIAEINKNVSVDIGIVGDITSALLKMTELCEEKKHPNWKKKIETYREYGKAIGAEMEKNAGDTLTPKKILDVINNGKNDNTVIVTDVGQHQMWTAQYARFERPRRLATSGGLGTMGYGMGAAIGAYIAEDERPILITGDGSFGMNMTELATAVTYNIPMIIVIMNNGVLGMVRQWQTLFYDKHYSSTVLDRKTDFVKIAEAFGARGERVDSAESFKAAFERAVSYSGPYLIDAAIGMDEFVLPMLPPGAKMEDIITEDFSSSDVSSDDENEKDGAE